VPKIIINNTINLFLTEISILVISNHNSFRVQFDKIASYVLFEKYICILALKMASPGTSTVPVVSALSFPVVN